MTNDYPEHGALISLVQAQLESRCRVCGETMFRDEFLAGEVINDGQEMGHRQCLRDLRLMKIREGMG